MGDGEPSFMLVPLLMPLIVLLVGLLISGCVERRASRRQEKLDEEREADRILAADCDDPARYLLAEDITKSHDQKPGERPYGAHRIME